MRNSIIWNSPFSDSTISVGSWARNRLSGSQMIWFTYLRWLERILVGDDDVNDESTAIIASVDLVWKYTFMSISSVKRDVDRPRWIQETFEDLGAENFRPSRFRCHKTIHLLVRRWCPSSAWDRLQPDLPGQSCCCRSKKMSNFISLGTLSWSQRLIQWVIFEARQSLWNIIRCLSP